MRWKKGRRSDNVEDRRGGGVIRRAPRGVKLGGGAAILALLAALLLGQDPTQVLDMLGSGDLESAVNQAPPAGTSTPQDEAGQFVSVVLAETEDTWNGIFREHNAQYREPTLVLFERSTPTACGTGSTATGPFYCPGDQKVYLDLDFLRELQRLGASGDFAVAYVIAHEIGHHVQTLEGTERQVRQLQARSSQRERNQLSVLMELQADCYAGVWAHRAQRERNILEDGDIEEGMNAAASVGDDRLQQMSGRPVQPDAFTHGSSRQRVEWFRKGLQTGSIASCDTFGQAGYR